MSEDKLLKQRFELKYLAPNEDVSKLRDFIRSRLDFDEHSLREADHSYRIDSFYLDSEDLRLHRAAVSQDADRFQLRLRYYSTEASAPVYFEIKRHLKECVLKQRCGVRRDCVPGLLLGQTPSPEHLVRNGANALGALRNFHTLAEEIHARPRVHVSCLREAYENEDNQVRVTIDRKLCGQSHREPSLETLEGAQVALFDGYCILELKFFGDYPEWFRELTRVFGLKESGSSKYREVMRALMSGGGGEAG